MSVDANPSNGGSAPAPKKTVDMVNLTIDGKAVTVPKGTNLIEAARSVQTEVPHYCYHPHLSVAGNCRICKVKVEGMPKLAIGCNTPVAEGMKVSTGATSKEVQAAQAATLEFILINHPLDCTVCDQSGQCKLQDYHYEYNAKPSRFLEDKQLKVKAVPLGENVMLDGERCIMCSRCVRFCDEVTGTSELGLLNRGDKTVIAVHPGKELNNELSGTVVDLCPVGALTHKKWRFTSRIWYTKEAETICPGCSTGCNAKIASRDGEIVQVRARLNSEVNKEWMCDEGRYGMERFQPKSRNLAVSFKGKPSNEAEALSAAAQLRGRLLLLASPDLTLEEFSLLKIIADTLASRGNTVRSELAYLGRNLSTVEKILVSPDRAANFRGAELAGFVSEASEERYRAALRALEVGEFDGVMLFGDRAIMAEVESAKLHEAIQRIGSLAIAADGARFVRFCQSVLPGRTILEKDGLLVNRAGRVQYNNRSLDGPQGSQADSFWLLKLAAKVGAPVPTATSERELTLWLLGEGGTLGRRAETKGLTISRIKSGGVQAFG